MSVGWVGVLVIALALALMLVTVLVSFCAATRANSSA